MNRIDIREGVRHRWLTPNLALADDTAIYASAGSEPVGPVTAGYMSPEEALNYLPPDEVAAVSATTRSRGNGSTLASQGDAYPPEWLPEVHRARPRPGIQHESGGY